MLKIYNENFLIIFSVFKNSKRNNGNYENNQFLFEIARESGKRVWTG